MTRKQRFLVYPSGDHREIWPGKIQPPSPPSSFSGFPHYTVSPTPCFPHSPILDYAQVSWILPHSLGILIKVFKWSEFVDLRRTTSRLPTEFRTSPNFKFFSVFLFSLPPHKMAAEGVKFQSIIMPILPSFKGNTFYLASILLVEYLDCWYRSNFWTSS